VAFPVLNSRQVFLGGQFDENQRAKGKAIHHRDITNYQEDFSSTFAAAFHWHVA